MINCSQSAVWSANRAVGVCEALEGLGRCDLMNQVSVNVDQASAIVLLVDDVVLKDLVIQGLGL